MKKTYQPKQKEVKRSVHRIDAKGQVVGRIASEIATLLIGKHKPTYSAHMDSGDVVFVKNAGEAIFTGKKEDNKLYQSHSGFPGGFKETTPKRLRATHPNKILEKAVYNMLPSNRLRANRMTRLRFEK